VRTIMHGIGNEGEEDGERARQAFKVEGRAWRRLVLAGRAGLLVSGLPVTYMSMYMYPEYLEGDTTTEAFNRFGVRLAWLLSGQLLLSPQRSRVTACWCPVEGLGGFRRIIG